MLKEDIETLARIGNALWVDSVYSANSTLETISAVSLMELTPERALEKAATAMLKRAKSRSLLTNASIKFSKLLEHPFFRLESEQRFLLVALHLGNWSYSRLSRIMGISEEVIQERTWDARLLIGSNKVYPAGPSSIGPHCPEYDSVRPWTQRFLDDEISAVRDRIFLQQHMMACAFCSAALTRCRDFYFEVEKTVSEVMNYSDIAESVSQVIDLRPKERGRFEMTFLESLSKFVRRKDIFFLLILVVGIFCLLQF